MTAALPNTAPRPIVTVQGPIAYEHLGITDAHNHLWIDPVPGAAPDSPVLNQFELILKELVAYREQGGGTILDCQPGGCGRNGIKLLELSRASQVKLIACTGFHRKRYYPQGYWLWEASAHKVSDMLLAELQQGLGETLDTPSVVRAGFIKIALEAKWSDCPQAALEATSSVAHETGAVIEIHTEKGALAEKASVYFTNRGCSSSQLVLCHLDKRPDASLHKALASFGVLLEYDTFYRPKYEPELNLWPLIEQMVSAGFADRIALATDMADANLYRSNESGTGGSLGLASLPGEIRNQLRMKGIPEEAQKQMLGENIARRLAGVP